MKRVLTGLQPSGTLHLGNYFGAIKPILELQNDDSKDLFLFIASYHALTTVKDREILRKNISNSIIDLLSLGVNPNKITFFNQSDVKEVLELNLILSNLVPLPHLERAHAYKDKVAKGISSNHGLFSYPILMASDILLYDTDIVPVGKDQIQHVQITRDIAIMFNETYGKYFKLPEFQVKEDVAVVPGIDGKKMSKSYNNFIPIFSSHKDLKKKISSIITNSTPMEEVKDFNNCNVFALCSLFMNELELVELKKLYNTPGYGFGHFKEILYTKMTTYFGEFYENRIIYEKNPDLISDIMNTGKNKAKEISSKKIEEIRNLIGL